MKMQQELALAETVSLGALDRYEGLTACVAWIESAIREFNMAQRAAGEPTVTVRFMPLLAA